MEVHIEMATKDIIDAIMNKTATDVTQAFDDELSSKILDKLEFRKKELAKQIYEPDSLTDEDIPVVDEPESIPVVDEPESIPVVDEPTDSVDMDFDTMVSSEDEVGSEIEG
tara:strand:- start:403 stop:735 length:333 start_codon:yes stop_codon:yes gene_type:complete